MNLQFNKTRANAIYALLKRENYIKHKRKIYALLKTVYNNTKVSVWLKTHINPCSNLQLFKTHSEISERFQSASHKPFRIGILMEE